MSDRCLIHVLSQFTSNNKFSTQRLTNQYIIQVIQFRLLIRVFIKIKTYKKINSVLRLILRGLR